MEEQDIERIIKRVFFHSEQLITQLLKERKATGDYRREVFVQEEGFVYQFVVCKHRDKYPATRKNFCFSIAVRKTEQIDNVFTCSIEPDGYSSYLFGNVNRQGALVMRNPLLTDISHINKLIHTGDTVCLQRGGLANGREKVAFAKVEILSEKYDNENISRKVTLTKDLGHPEIYAYTVYPNKVATYTGDEQTSEYFGERETITGVLGFCLDKTYTTYNDVGWYRYEKEKIFNRLQDTTLELGEPQTVVEVTQKVRMSALEDLLKNCDGEFAYGDSRVRKYADYYAILGDELIEKIYAKYMLWLKIFSTKESVDGAECSGIAVRCGDNQRPPFEAYLSTERKEEIAMLEALPSSMEEAEALLPIRVARLEDLLIKLFGADFYIKVLPYGKAYKISIVDSDTFSKATFMIVDGFVSSLEGSSYVTCVIEEKKLLIQQFFLDNLCAQ